MSNKTIFLLIVLIIPLLSILSCEKDPEKVYNTDKEIIPGIPQDILNNLDINKIEVIIDQVTNHDKSIDNLANYILDNFDNDAEKSYAIYYWIIRNISYDDDLSQNVFGFRGDDRITAEGTFDRRKGICDGYSRLYCLLCEKSDMKACYISGYTPSDYPDLPDPLLYGMHAWNAVCIKGKWYFVDSTWAQYLIEPQEFYQTHLPYDKKWKMF